MGDGADLADDNIPIKVNNSTISGAFTNTAYQAASFMFYGSAWHLIDPNAGLGNMATLDSPLGIANGGTGATTAAAARTAIGALGQTVTGNILLQDTSTVAGTGTAMISATRGTRSSNINKPVLAIGMNANSQSDSSGFGTNTMLFGGHGVVLGAGENYYGSWMDSISTSCVDNIILYSDNNVIVKTGIDKQYTNGSGASLSYAKTWTFEANGNLTAGAEGQLVIADNVAWFGTSTTAGGTATKVVTCPGFRLHKGAQITVNFTNSNTVSNPSLNVNGTGAKPILSNYGATTLGSGFFSNNATITPITRACLSANIPVTFYYNETGYVPVEGRVANLQNSGFVTYTDVNAIWHAQAGSTGMTTYYGRCSTASTTAAKVITCPEFTSYPKNDFCIVVKFDNNNSSSSPTFNVNSTGAKSVVGVAGLANNLATGITAGNVNVYRYSVALDKFILARKVYHVTYGKNFYCTCETAAATTAKVNTDSTHIRVFYLTTGTIVTVNFTVANSATNPTLNINGTGAKPIYKGSTRLTKATLIKGIYTLQYDGTNYIVISEMAT